ncbi:hypothetical protein AAH003_04885 [Bacteroides uniformis]|jgi:hypothetical protein
MKELWNNAATFLQYQGRLEFPDAAPSLLCAEEIHAFSETDK